MNIERQMKIWENEMKWIREGNHKMRQQMDKMSAAMKNVIEAYFESMYYQGIDVAPEE